MPAKIVAITMAKNEIDIIEAFVRHTLVFASHLVILDDESTDGTLELLRFLKEEGLSLTILEASEPGFHQSSRMTRLMVEHAIGIHDADWVLPLDVDEFVATTDGELLIEPDTPTSHILSLPWRNYLPHHSDDDTELNPVLKIRHRVKKDYQNLPGSILIPSEIASLPDAVIITGNHNLKIGGTLSEPKPHQHAYLGHFQIRSRDQFLSKCLICKLQYNINPALDPPAVDIFFSFHNRTQVNAIKRNPENFQEQFLNAAQKWLEIYDGEEPEVLVDPFPYQGGPLKHPQRIAGGQGWLSVFHFAESLSSRHAALLSTLDHQGRALYDKESKKISALRFNLEKVLDEFFKKENVIQDQHRQLLEKEKLIQDQHRQLLEKEKAIQDQSHRLHASQKTHLPMVIKNCIAKFVHFANRSPS
jgi:glycosyltransferase involved in cell wall biosynthesis